MIIKLTGNSSFIAVGTGYTSPRAYENAQIQLNKQIKDFASRTLTGSPGFGSLISHSYTDQHGQKMYLVNQKVLEVWVARTFLAGILAKFVFPFKS